MMSFFRKYKMPLTFLIIYIMLIFIFAVVYTFYGDDFYHTTVQYENYTDQEYQEIKSQIQNLLRNKIKNTYEHHSVYLDKEKNWFLNINDLYVSNFKVKKNKLDIDLLMYITNGEKSENKDEITFITKESKKFKLVFAGYSKFDSKNELQTFGFNIINDEENVEYNVNKIFNKNGSTIMELKVPYELSKKIDGYTRSVYGFPNNIDGKFIRMLYLSMVTITTLGYGDIVPLSNLTRILVGLESFLGIVIIGWFATALLNDFNKNK